MLSPKFSVYSDGIDVGVEYRPRILCFRKDRGDRPLPTHRQGARPKRCLILSSMTAGLEVTIEEFVLIQFRFGHGTDKFPHGDSNRCRVRIQHW
jgi:hypothetical protein